MMPWDELVATATAQARINALRDELLTLDAMLTAATTQARQAGMDEVAAFLETANDQVDAAIAALPPVAQTRTAVAVCNREGRS